jgi:pilus assembly protein Flp/PilA
MMFSYVNAKLQSLLNREEGQSMVEYGMIIGLVAVGVVVVLTMLGTQINAMFQNIVTALTPAPQ